MVVKSGPSSLRFPNRAVRSQYSRSRTDVSFRRVGKGQLRPACRARFSTFLTFASRDL